MFFDLRFKPLIIGSQCFCWFSGLRVLVLQDFKASCFLGLGLSGLRVLGSSSFCDFQASGSWFGLVR